jgi:hypothetical protein
MTAAKAGRFSSRQPDESRKRKTQRETGMIIPDSEGGSPLLEEAARELEAATHDARVAFDCIGLGELDRAHTSAVTARAAVDAAVTALQAVLSQVREVPRSLSASGIPCCLPLPPATAAS